MTDALRTTTLRTPPSVAARVARRREVLHWIAVHTLGITAALFFLLPFVFLLLTSLMTDRQALTSDLWPHDWAWDNYSKVWATPGFLLWWRNTLLYAGLGTVLTILSSVPVAYALAKFRFIARPPSSKSQPESARLLARPLHTFLVIALPDLRPRPAVHVGHLVLDLGAGR